MSRAERLRVPLNSRCSRKWETPARWGGSSREPTPTQIPNDTLRMAGIDSVRIRSPLGRTVRRTVPPNGSAAMVRVLARGVRSTMDADRHPGSAVAVPATAQLAALTDRLRALLAVPARAALAAAPVTPRPTVAAVPPGGALRLGRRSRFTLGAHLVEVDLAAVVDVRDLHLDLVADVEVVLDLLDPLAVADLGDVQQPVAAGQERDERAERGGLDDRPEEPVAHLGQGRVGDRVDAVDRRLRRRSVERADVDRAVVLDGDLGTGLVLDRVDRLTLRADDHTDLVDRDVDRGDPRGVLGHAGRRGDGLRHHVQDRLAGVVGLLERGGQHLGRDAVQLGV